MLPGFGKYAFGQKPFGSPEKPRVFVSYHHDNDQEYYDRFSMLFGKAYDILTDTSADRLIRSDDAEYQMRRIREDYITGSSVTVVLCGAESYKRKFIDWEICATLNKGHGLLGINLPTNPVSAQGKVIVPSRLHDNIESGYAMWMQWTEGPALMAKAIDNARSRATQGSLIRNSRATMERNLP